MKIFFFIIFIPITQVFAEANSDNLCLKNLSYNEDGKIDQSNEFNRICIKNYLQENPNLNDQALFCILNNCEGMVTVNPVPTINANNENIDKVEGDEFPDPVKITNDAPNAGKPKTGVVNAGKDVDGVTRAVNIDNAGVKPKTGVVQPSKVFNVEEVDTSVNAAPKQQAPVTKQQAPVTKQQAPAPKIKHLQAVDPKGNPIPAGGAPKIKHLQAVDPKGNPIP